MTTPVAGVVRAPVAVALDAPDGRTAAGWARAVAPHVSVLKIGMELFYREGPAVVDAVRDAGAGAGIFLDLKLHDIPATVAGAVRSVGRLGPRYLTVHAAGGGDMVRAAVDAAAGGPAPVGIAAVTVLTSLDAAGLAAVGLLGGPDEAALRLAVLAVSAGATTLVCSPREVAAVRARVGPAITLITPGIRPAGAAAHDQARVATPASALAAGADLLVVGRPITAAPDPAAAAAAISADLRTG